MIPEPDYIGIELPSADAAPDVGRKSKAGRGRFGVLNQFVDQTIRRIDVAAVLVWIVLFRDTKPDGLARASQKNIAERIGRSVRTVYEAVRQLERAGLVTVVRRGRLNGGVSVYRVRPLIRDGFQPAIRRNRNRQSVAKATAADCRYPRRDPEGSPR
jgi:DNA-binding transcriptional ArsR family regulator